MDEHSGAHALFSPKTSFIGGIVVGVLVLCTIGFFVLLGIVLTSGGVSVKNGAFAPAFAAAPSPLPSLPPAPAGLITVKAVSKDDHVKGDRKAKISIVEFSDTECPFCQRFHPTLQDVVKQYDGKVNWVYRHFPLRGLHSKAAKEAEATECAAELGGNDGFWKYLDRLFEVTPANNGLDESELPKIAEAVGLNRAKFETCLASGKYASKVSDHEAEAAAAGAQGTPYAVIVGPNDKKEAVSGAVPATELQRVIDGFLAS